jgi:hypothetical protein
MAGLVLSLAWGLLPDWAQGPWYFLKDPGGPLFDEGMGWCLLAISVFGMCAPMFWSGRRAWLVAALAFGLWLLTGWWFSYTAAV